MPEGHTIHRLARDHSALLKGVAVGVSSPQGRFADGAGRLDGRTVTRIEPYGKHLWYSFSGTRERLHVHLGLYGKFTQGPLPAPEPRGALRLRLTTDASWLDLRGPTACELMAPPERSAVLARLGPDPLAAKPDGAAAFARLSRSRTPLGALLMDQSVLAGVGNVYRRNFSTGRPFHRSCQAASCLRQPGRRCGKTSCCSCGQAFGRAASSPPARSTDDARPAAQARRTRTTSTAAMACRAGSVVRRSARR